MGIRRFAAVNDTAGHRRATAAAKTMGCWRGRSAAVVAAAGAAGEAAAVNDAVGRRRVVVASEAARPAGGLLPWTSPGEPAGRRCGQGRWAAGGSLPWTTPWGTGGASVVVVAARAPAWSLLRLLLRGAGGAAAVVEAWVPGTVAAVPSWGDGGPILSGDG